MSSTSPTLLGRCAHASTVREASFRIDGPRPPRRHARVIALDEGARRAVEPVQRARSEAGAYVAAHGGDGDDAPMLLPLGSGEPCGISAALDGADLVLMVATSAQGADHAAAIGREAAQRRVMTSGLVSDGDGTGAAIRALRPHAQVLLVSKGGEDLEGLLDALRA